ncbi:hypothetical protein [Antrihabitans cavernicola]|nr:hypothetical protein [Spelaeibacter cavernicola]
MSTLDPPTLIDTANNPALQYLRDHHDQHRAITTARDTLAPPPF